MSATEQAKETGNVAQSARSFYNWTTLGSFAGAATAVNIIWVTLQSLNLSWADSNVVPLVTSICIMLLYGIFSEPDERTTWWQKGQKTLQGLMNGLLIYSAVVGIGGLVVTP